MGSCLLEVEKVTVEALKREARPLTPSLRRCSGTAAGGAIGAAAVALLPADGGHGGLSRCGARGPSVHAIVSGAGRGSPGQGQHCAHRAGRPRRKGGRRRSDGAAGVVTSRLVVDTGGGGGGRACRELVATAADVAVPRDSTPHRRQDSVHRAGVFFRRKVERVTTTARARRELLQVKWIARAQASKEDTVDKPSYGGGARHGTITIHIYPDRATFH
nr:unnamed protein product [Digitaria exilis]